VITNPRLATLYVPDQARTREFLTGVAGFELVVDAVTPEGRWVELRPPGAQTCVVLAAAGPELLAALRARVGRMADAWFDCADLDASWAELRRRGVEFLVPPRPAPWRPTTRWAQFDGPDGMRYGLTEAHR
jgi:catechol 2,3-dioxygenase-like lactoylglutathione lyase family enzyme